MPRWTPEQTTKLLALAQTHTDAELAPIFGRSIAAVRTQRVSNQARPKLSRWTAKEDAVLLGSPDTNLLPGRTAVAVKLRRHVLGIRRQEKAALWTPAEDCALTLNPRSPAIAGRTSSGIQNRRRYLGIRLLSAPAVLRSVPRDAEILAIIGRAVRSDLPAQMRDDVIQEVALGIFDGTYRLVNVREAVKAATRTINRMYPTLGAPVSLDARLHGDGPTLIERVSEGLWSGGL